MGRVPGIDNPARRLSECAPLAPAAVRPPGRVANPSSGAGPLPRTVGESPDRAGEPDFASLVDNSSLGIVVTGACGIRYVNPEACRLFGRSSDDLVSRDVDATIALLHPDDRDRIRDRLERRLAGDPVSGPAEARIQRPDASEVWVESHASIWVDGGERFVLSFLLDVTTFRDTQHALASTRHLNARIAATSPFILYVFDIREQRNVYVNREIWHDLGYTPAEIAAMGTEFLPRLLHPDDLAGVDDLIRRWDHVADDDVYETEYRMRHVDGSYRWFLARDVVYSRDENGQVVQILGAAQDITRRREMEAELARREEAHRILLDAIPDLVFGLDPDGRFRYVRASAAELLQDPEDLRGIHFRDVLPADVSDALDRALSEARAGSAPIQMAYRLTLRDGRTRDYDARVSVADDGGIVAFCRDVTEQRALEIQLRQAQKMEAVGRLAGGVAHDFNNLLTVVLGGVDIVLGDLPEESPVRPQLEDIRGAGERGAELTRKLLAFSRRQLVEPRVVEVTEVIRGSERMLRHVIRENIVLETRLFSDSGRADIDPNQLEQILLNLVVNARDAMPAGGRIIIDCRPVEVDEELAARNPDAVTGSFIRIAVDDTGEGIDPGARAHLFEPFFTTKEPGKGSGLGLATSYGIARQHGGFFEVEPSSARGTSMRLYLPRVERPASGVKPDAEPAMPGGSERVLLVEDDAAVRLMAGRVLRELGYDVRTANDGVEALRYIDSGLAPDLLVTDLVMPRMGGHLLADSVRERHPGVAILMMTGYSDDTSLVHATEEAGTALLRKPFSIRTLARRARDVLDERRGPSS